MANNLRIVLAQLNFLVGDIEGNRDKIITYAKKAKDEHQADLVMFPELCLTGYPPEDLLFRPFLYERVNKAIETIREQVKDIYILIGYPKQTEAERFNAACLLYQGKTVAEYAKQDLPNYNVFDEKRYFKPGKSSCVVEIKGVRTAIIICEDLWHTIPTQQAKEAGAQVMLSINASPYNRGKPLMRQELLYERARYGGFPIAYVNMVGGQDELVFDGGSMVADKDGCITHKGAFCEEELIPVTIECNNALHIEPSLVLPNATPNQHIYEVLVLGVRDYIEKNYFKGAVIGLSGGIDSALTLAIAVDAIGKEHVHAIMMPSRYTSNISIEDAKAEAEKLGVNYSTISIEPMFNSFIDGLKDEFKRLPPDVTEENIQARCRGVLLMAVSNKKGLIVLSTGNKSELSVGYSTLYGDLVGGFCVLKDVPKTLVYRLSHYRNSISNVIPKRVLERAPSAELAPDQTDQDSLPPYDILDAILDRYIDKEQSIDTIAAAGFGIETVRNVVKMIDRNEYKRRQAPIGVRISTKAFGRDRRYPITSGYNF